MILLKDLSQKHILNTLHQDGSPFSLTRQSAAGAQP
jgi:hypothetical protein